MAVCAAAVCAAAVLLASGCGDDGDDSDDPYRNAISDKRAPEVTVSLRDDDGEPVVDISYDVPRPTDPGSRQQGMRGTYAFLQALDEGTWSTAYTLDDGEIIEGVPEAVEQDAYAGPGPDTYRLPDLDPDDTYRICVDFVVGHPATSALGCSDPFHSD